MTAYVPNVLMTAARMALPPSITKSRGCSTCSPRSIRLPNSALQTVLFSVVPSNRPSGCLRPSVSTPRATTMQCSATSTPSMNIATRSSWLRSRPNSSPSFCSVPWIKRCEIADLDVARASTRPTCSRPAEYRRVESPASILPNAASLSRSRLANVRKVRSSSSSSSTLRTRGLLTSTRRPPSVTWRCSWPCRYARRSASCFPFGPASRTTSASNSSSSTASPMPTEKASSPSFATPASSRRAIVTCLGRSCASRSLDAVTMRGRGMVVTGGLSFGLDTPFVTTTVKRGGGPPSISTNYRTTSARALLVLDNCEHLVSALAEMVEALLRGCARLVVLAVSREPLGIPGETTWRVPSLSLPGQTVPLTADSLAQYDAVRLFVDRARAALPAFVLSDSTAAGIASVCRLLDGIPLALELAAPRVRILSIEQVADRLDDALQFLPAGSRTAPLRQQTLRATLDWSYRLLTQPEQMLFDRLSVFAGGWTLEAAEALTVDDLNRSEVLDLLARLVDKSLVLAEPGEGGQPRYRLLETLRQYGREHLLADEVAQRVRSRLANYFMELGECAEPSLVGGPESQLWLNRLAAEQGNLRAALRWFTDRLEVDGGLRLGGAVWRFWYLRGTLAEGREWLALLLQLAAGSLPGAARAKVLNGAGVLAFQQADYAAAQTLLEESLEIWQQLSNPVRVATCTNNLASVAVERGDYAAACRLYEEALSLTEAGHDRARLANVMNNFAWMLAEQGEYDRARDLSSRSIEISGELSDERGVAHNTLSLAWCALQTGNPTD